MASKGGVLAISAIVGVGALVAFAATAKAATPPKGGGGGKTPAGFGGPNATQCQKWYDQRVAKIDAISNLNHTISSLDQQIAEYEAATGYGTPEDLLIARQNAVAQRNNLQAQANQLAVLMQDCE